MLNVPGVVLSTFAKEYAVISFTKLSDVDNSPVLTAKVPVMSETKT